MSRNLEHFGVKGMRWGVRRARRQEEKAIRKDYSARFKSQLEVERVRIQPQVDKHLAIADKLYRTHSFDADDGGGGLTLKDVSAGKQYMKQFDAIDKLQFDATVRASKTVVDAMVKDYGNVKVKQLISPPVSNELDL